MESAVGSRGVRHNSSSSELRERGSFITIVIAVAVLMNSCATPQSRQNQNANTQGQSASINWQAVEQAFGRSGTLQAGDVYRFSMPRGDLRVMARGIELRPALALGSWVAFKRMGNEAMVMGDLVLTEDEIAPVMTRLQQGGIEQTALHHHVLYESPRVFYMHIGKTGDPVRIAETIRAALALTRTPSPAPADSGQSQDLGIGTPQIEQIIGHIGRVNGGVLQISVPRAEQIREGGMVVPPSMGLATALNFQPTGDGRAAITGDFVMIASEVNPVIRALRENGIEVTALHNHMLTEEPRLFFMHFWANDDAVRLARGLRAALDRMNVARS
ncbi:MAG: DUF1259 domain-containing protein [Acidobacteria bacterium]|nr:DUF1259 domain-containing protein [Acidobacteriota bacterium]